MLIGWRVVGCWLAIPLAVGVAGCSSEEGTEPPTEHDVTYHRDLRPTIESSCFPCHQSGNIAPFTLESAEDLAGSIGSVVAAVESGQMPPWPADDECHPIADSRRLDDATRAQFRAWLEDDMPEGSEADYVAPVARQTNLPDLGEPTFTMRMPDAYTTTRPAPGESDEHRCFILPDTFDEDTYLKALTVRPGTKTVHHLQVHRIPPESFAEAEQRDRDDPGPGYSCFGGSARGSYNLYSWHPGSEVIRFGEGQAAFLPKGTRIALQIHFNVDSYLPADEIPEEITKVDFHTLPPGELPDYVVVRFFLSGGPIFLPPGGRDVVIDMQDRMTRASVVGDTFLPGEFIGHTPHMHWLGTRFNVTLERESGESQCLVDVPKWDFDWQLDYWYEPTEYIAFDETDEVHVQCDYDNSAANQPIVGGVQQAPRTVLYGESSDEEMCLNHTWVRYDRAAYVAALEAQRASLATPSP